MTWIPEHEVYCRTCHRMVTARADGRMAGHFRFNMNNYDVNRAFVLCRGEYALPGMTHGMEDTAVAFRPTEPDTYTETEAEQPPEPEPVPAKYPHPGHRFSFVMRSPT